MKLSLKGVFTLSLVARLLSMASMSAADDERHHFTIMPFGGYRFNGSIGLDDPHYSKVDVADDSVYGLSAGVEVPDGLVELMWTHQDTHANVIPVAGGPPPESFDMKTDQFHFNGLFFPPGFDRLQPYALGGVGATRYIPTGDFDALTRFSWALGGGVKVPLTTVFALRLEAKWDAALASSSQRIFCNSGTGQCLVTSSGRLINQFDFTAGLSLRL